MIKNQSNELFHSLTGAVYDYVLCQVWTLYTMLCHFSTKFSSKHYNYQEQKFRNDFLISS